MTDLARALELARQLIDGEEWSTTATLLLSNALLELHARQERMDLIADSIAHDLRIVAAHREARTSGGQQCGVGGNLAAMNPSGLIYLERIVREMRGTLASDEGGA